MKEREQIIEQLQNQVKKFGDQALLKAGADIMHRAAIENDMLRNPTKHARPGSGMGAYTAFVPPSTN